MNGFDMNYLLNVIWFRIMIALAGMATALSISAMPSSPRFENLGALNSDNLFVLSLLQDRQGFIWIGTVSRELYRYDGIRTTKYVNDPGNQNSLPNDRISALFEDKNGNIWAGTSSGLARFNPKTNDFTLFTPKSGPNNHRVVKKIISDGKDGLWLATWGGLQHFDLKSHQFQIYSNDPLQPGSLAKNDVNALAMDEKGGLWVATWPGGIDYLAPNATTFQHYRIDSAIQPDSKLNIIRSLYFDRRQRLWMGTESGIVLWQSGTDWSQRKKLVSPPNRINSIFEDKDANIWVATRWAGLLRWDELNQAFIHYTHQTKDSHSLPSNDITAIIQDRTGILWIGSFTDGVSWLNLNSKGFKRFIPYDRDTENSKPNNFITSIASDENGYLWLGGGSGFSLFDPVTDNILRRFHVNSGQSGSLSEDFVYSLYQAPGGSLWIGTSAGLNRLDKEKNQMTVIHFNNLASNFISRIVPGQGNILWLGTGNSMIRYDSASGAYKQFTHDPADPDSRSVNGASAILEDSAGRVWVGSEASGGGLDIMDQASGKFRHYRHDPSNPASLTNDYVTALFQDKRGIFWVGTSQGLNRAVPNAKGELEFRSYVNKNGLGPLHILSLHGDNNGHIWISTAAGLSKLDPETEHVEHYSASDGLTDGFIVASSAKTKDGTLYFGGTKGMTAVYPDMVQNMSMTPQVAITDIMIFNHSMKDGLYGAGAQLSGSVTDPKELTLSWRESVFALEFAALHYINPLKNRYAYRLEGFDKNWVETDATHHTATYTNLSPGKYIFRVKAANNKGVWNETGTALAITITPAFWQTWWFRILVTIFSLVMLFAIYLWRISHLTLLQKKLRKLVAERTAELETSNMKLAALSITDGLTGIANRRAFDETLEKEWEHAVRAQHSLALAMIDVDLFKKYNDHYGHQKGDKCLLTVAHVLNENVRRSIDLVARYGGEEFAFIAPLTDDASAFNMAENICKSLENLALAHEMSPFGVVTVSIGVAVITPSDTERSEILVKKADEALYLAKEQGRNRVVLASPFS
jgi:diguanylate cyclase (GGDEF)-like protein